jgi:hypothetical protein
MDMSQQPRGIGSRATEECRVTFKSKIDLSLLALSLVIQMTRN